MALSNYLIEKNQKNNNKTINVIDLMNRAKSQEKKEKRTTLLITAAALSVLVVAGVVISL